MQIQTGLDIGQRIVLREIGAPGIVRGIKLDWRNYTYLIDYWLDGKIQTVEVFEDQVEGIATKKVELRASVG